MKQLIFIILLFSFFYSCSKPFDHCELANQAMFSYSKEMQKKGILLEGFGGAMMNDIKKFNLHYLSSKKIEINEARSLALEIVGGFLKKINSDQKIRAYLHNFPMDEKNLEIFISFRDQEDKRHPVNYISLIILTEGILYYSIWDSSISHPQKFLTIHKEPYSEALKTVNDQDKDKQI